MMLKASFEKRVFIFKRPGGTSRGILAEKKAWFISLWNEKNPKIKGIGECSVIPLLSPDYRNDEEYERKIAEVVTNINHFAENIENLRTFPSIYFGLEMALLDLKNGGKRRFFETDFTAGKSSLPINGLIWMGDSKFMQEQIEQKLEEGYSCIKLKIGAIDFSTELELIEGIRKRYSADEITIRVDANGAFSPHEATSKLTQLNAFSLHSIEQPIRQGQEQEMKKLCAKNILPIALDEELIGIYDKAEKERLLTSIQPQYIILKPSLIGGFKGTQEWINCAEKLQIKWWITSALESNIGLEAIAQFTSQYDINLPQGLGTGALYVENWESDLYIKNGHLRYQRG